MPRDDVLHKLEDLCADADTREEVAKGAISVIDNANIQIYEYFNDRSFFQDKSYQAVEGWKNLGRAAWDDPLSMVAPRIMEAWRDPTSPATW